MYHCSCWKPMIAWLMKCLQSCWGQSITEMCRKRLISESLKTGMTNQRRLVSRGHKVETLKYLGTFMSPCFCKRGEELHYISLMTVGSHSLWSEGGWFICHCGIILHNSEHDGHDIQWLGGILPALDFERHIWTHFNASFRRFNILH